MAGRKDGSGPGRLAGLRRRVRPGPRPPEGPYLGPRGQTPVVRVTGGSNKRVSLAALIAIRPGLPARLIYRVHRRRAWLIAANVSQAARLSSRCVRSGVTVPGMLGDRPPVPPRQLADQRRHVLPRLQPRLCPDEARLQQPQQLSSFPAAQPGPYPGSSSRLRFVVLTNT